jgi:hypothetical protein
MKCRYHRDREAYLICQKMDTGYCSECFDRSAVCSDPNGYCKFRSQCIIWEKTRNEKRNRREREDAAETPSANSAS